MFKNLIGYVAALPVVGACLSIVWFKTRAHQDRVTPGPDTHVAESDVDEGLDAEVRQLLSGSDQRVF
jgi:hypothetical protein